MQVTLTGLEGFSHTSSIKVHHVMDLANHIPQ